MQRKSAADFGRRRAHFAELLSGELVDAAGLRHFIVMVIEAKLAETSTPSLAPRSSSTTPFSLRNLTPETPAATAAPPPTPV